MFKEKYPFIILPTKNWSNLLNQDWVWIDSISFIDSNLTPPADKPCNRYLILTRDIRDITLFHLSPTDITAQTEIPPAKKTKHHL